LLLSFKVAQVSVPILNHHLTWSFRPHYGPGIDSTSNRNEYQ